MTSYTSLPVQVEAVHYAADASNVDELIAFIEAAGLVAAKQEPWNPGDGQSCVQVRAEGDGDGVPLFLVSPGQFVAAYSTGLVTYSAGDFAALYDVPDAPESAPAPAADSTPPADQPPTDPPTE